MTTRDRSRWTRRAEHPEPAHAPPGAQSPLPARARRPDSYVPDVHAARNDLVSTPALAPLNGAGVDASRVVGQIAAGLGSVDYVQFDFRKVGMPESLDRTILASPPLVVTLAQVRFEERAELAEVSVASELREPMAAHGLTSAVQVHVQQVVFGASESSAGAEASAKVAVGWQFKAPGDAAVVTVLRDQVSLEVKRYPGWETFLDIWEMCVEGVLGIVKPELVTRLGLRYVNRVRPRGVTNAANWGERGLVDTSFLGPSAGSALSQFVTAVEGRAALAFPDGVEALVHHGVDIEENTQVFMLDIDCFSTRAVDFSVATLSGRLRALNDHSLGVFQEVVKERLRAEMIGAKGEVL
jgi:uncharacterized protein (TIGR04255 family)